MKIMYIVNSLVIGGTERVAVNYLLGLKELGEDVVLLQAQDKHTFLNEKLQHAGIRTLTASMGIKPEILDKVVTAYRFRKYIEKEKPDVIHVHTGLEKFRFVNYPACRVIFKLHSEWSRCKAYGKNHRKMLFRMIEQGMLLVALSRKAETDVHSEFPDAKMCILPNGLPLDEIRGNRYDRKVFRRELGIPENAFVVGHVGRFHSVKNHEKLIAVFGEVLKREQNAYLVLVGDGNDEERQHIHNLADAERLKEHIVYLGIRQDATAVMSTFDVFVLPSHSEAMPNTLLEAQALGVRSVVSNAIPPETCCNCNCIQLDLKEPDAVWAQQILSDSEMEHEHTIEEFDIWQILKQYQELYWDVACER